MSNKFDFREWWSSYTRKNTYVLALIIFFITTAAYLALQPNAFEEGVLSRLITSNFRTWLPVTLLAIGQTFVMLGGGGYEEYDQG
jgi:ribose/xylose/arabinose/galactoside ABC-type transport system permease subunit